MSGSEHVESDGRRDLRRRAESLGLSTVHISAPQPSGSIRCAVGGNHARLRGDQLDYSVGGTRGDVSTFSNASRRRLLAFFQSVNRDKAGLPLFVTLTYPGEWPADHRVWKRDLRAWLDRLRRLDAHCWAVWRLEPQRRGAPHYHLLVFGRVRLDKVWLSETWYEVVGSGDLRHKRAGTQVERIRSWRGVTSYAAKYLAKEVEALPGAWSEGVGRWWGVHNRKAAPREVMEAQLSQSGWFRVRRVLRRLLRGPGGRHVWWSDGRGAAGAILRRGQQASVCSVDVVRLVDWVQQLDANPL